MTSITNTNGENIPTEGAVKTYVDGWLVSSVTATFDEDVAKGMAVVLYKDWGVTRAKKAINGSIIWNGNVTNVWTVDTTSITVSPNASIGSFVSIFSNGSGAIFFSANANNTTSRYYNFQTDLISYVTSISSSLLTYSTSAEFIWSGCTLKYTFDQDNTKKYTILLIRFYTINTTTTSTMSFGVFNHIWPSFTRYSVWN